LNNNHAYRKKEFSVIKRAVIDDNFGYFSGEAFASGAFKDFTALVGSQNVQQGDYVTSMANATNGLMVVAVALSRVPVELEAHLTL